ncbi:hypothetical protein FIBSPDRAFT_818004 [Athelia psychrophila]|uniref:Histone chaperone RTT106/FACT complex subunit SPT16-like middle domain-containing protein n=1 Tax=Athelia psychrophila TaxID=1759441 RepID=A0A166R7A1_9AGAM|nr:hypothetical protein FIBSPDRAFT_818004 [Fibularhizoctonia sp. CBS 109695]
MSTSYLQTLRPFLPEECLPELDISCQNPSTEAFLETLILFVAGGRAPEHVSAPTKQAWLLKQADAKTAFDALNPLKRAREDDDVTEPQNGVKRQKGPNTLPAADDPPIFCLHTISATSPVRKKVDITVHKCSIVFTHPTTHAVEATVPLASLRRSFLVPTRGKQKPHWTIILLSSDAPERGKQPKDANPQVIFGLDATTSSNMTTTFYSSSSEPTKVTLLKGADVLPSLRQFLGHTGLQILEPSASVFRSACAGNLGASASTDGVPGAEAYRAAKPGNLWFMKEGILWGEAKPCEFWAVEDLLGKESGLRTISATGRTCSVILARKETQVEGGEGNEGEEEEEDLGIETEFAMVDGKEREGILQWVRQFRNHFGKKPVQIGQAGGNGVVGGLSDHTSNGVATIATTQLDESDASDDSFEDPDSDDGGSASSESAGGSGAGSDDESAEGEDSDAGGEDGDEDEDENLRAENHPLMRPGAMPKMSRAAIEAVVGMVNDDLMGEESEGEDELED